MITEKYHKNTSFWRTQLIQIVLQTGLIIFSLGYRFNASKIVKTTAWTESRTFPLTFSLITPVWFTKKQNKVWWISELMNNSEQWTDLFSVSKGTFHLWHHPSQGVDLVSFFVHWLFCTHLLVASSKTLPLVQ